ncbi:hypothetical protein BGZ49_005033 [Haplosporangium sp. Z 27]|nr:hypothetical protein BGZ49_005033 [Haplosporangium sp. Z 27]
MGKCSRTSILNLYQTVCKAGRCACPREDGGGPWVYDQVLETLDESNVEERERIAEWLDSDPAYFDKEDANKRPEDFRSLM